MDKRIIEKEDAVFWLDKDGNWQNEHGRFQHPKLIRFFHSSIQKDDNGYFVSQTTDEFEEKVYFRYEDTALFVFDIDVGDAQVRLLLNTGEDMMLNPEQLVQKKDCLYVETLDHSIKFTQKTLVKLSAYMVEKDGVLGLDLNGKTWEIK